MEIADSLVTKTETELEFSNFIGGVVNGHIRQISRASRTKSASVLLDISDRLADKLMKDATGESGVFFTVKGLEIRWWEDKPNGKKKK